MYTFLYISLPQQIWDNITKEIHKTSKEIIGEKKRKHYSVNPTVIKLSEEQRQLHIEMNNNGSIMCRDLRRKRNNKLKEIHQILEHEKHNKVIEQANNINNSKNNSTQMYKAVKIVQRKNPKTPLIINTEIGTIMKKCKHKSFTISLKNSSTNQQEKHHLKDR